MQCHICSHFLIVVIFCVLSAPNVYTENEQVAKYEIMDGAPVRGTILFVCLSTRSMCMCMYVPCLSACSMCVYLYICAPCTCINGSCWCRDVPKTRCWLHQCLPGNIITREQMLLSKNTYPVDQLIDPAPVCSSNSNV